MAKYMLSGIYAVNNLLIGDDMHRILLTFFFVLVTSLSAYSDGTFSIPDCKSDSFRACEPRTNLAPHCSGVNYRKKRCSGVEADGSVLGCSTSCMKILCRMPRPFEIAATGDRLERK
jgi:hypothetical protein